MLAEREWQAQQRMTQSSSSKNPTRPLQMMAMRAPWERAAPMTGAPSDEHRLRSCLNGRTHAEAGRWDSRPSTQSVIPGQWRCLSLWGYTAEAKYGEKERGG